MNTIQKFIVYPIGAIAIVFGLYVQFGSEDLSKLNSDKLEVVPAAIVMYEYGKNELRAIEKYKNKPIQVVGVYHQLWKEEDSKLRIMVLETWNTSALIYVNLPKSAKKELINLDKGTLVSINCMNLETHGTSPIFKSCDFIKKIDTKGERPDLYLDDLIAKNNPLLNPKK